MPPFLVFTNRHLLLIIAARPETPNALLQLDGIGPGKVKRYGKELLELLGGAGPGGELGSVVKPRQWPVAQGTPFLVSTPQPKMRSRRLGRSRLGGYGGCPARCT